ncbi:MAG: T9SS type A sorting domain-containing protein [Brumimicrobium sp.]|nr:T9SS type A sorting domain-containing protein [Brumimicrobium sp.]
MKSLKSILAAAFILVCLFSNAQAYIKATFVGTPQPGTCNNIVACEVYNYTGHNKVQLAEYGVHIQDVHHLDTIYNFCYDPTHTTVPYEFDLVRSNGYRGSVSGPVSPILPEFEFDVISYQAPTADTIFDGNITIQFDSIIDQTNFGFDLLSGNIPHQVTSSFIDDYTVQFDSLNRGEFRVFSVDSTGLLNNSFNIFVGDLDPDWIDTGLQVSVNYQHSNGNCEGFIDVFAVQEHAGSSLLIIWNDTQLGYDYSISNLCPGMYSFYAYETSPVEIFSAFIDTLIITNSNASFIDSSLYNTVPDDTLLYQINNCYYDYSLPVDSVNFNLDTISLTQDSLTALFQLTIFQQQQSTYLEDTIYAHVDSSTVLDIVLYCYDSTGQKAAFQSKQFLIMLNSQGNVAGNDLSVDFQNKSAARVFPNPIVNELKIEAKNKGIIEAIHILDSQGKRQLFEVPGTSEVILDVSHLSKGTYLIWYKVNNSWYQQKVVK